MITIRMAFPAGRYHATPWDRHVNEGVVSWPPEPWRILRSLVAVWHRTTADGSDDTVLAKLIDRFASTLPAYRLPFVTDSHTRHYMPVIEGSSETRALVFDGFLRLEQPLFMNWPVNLAQNELELLRSLISNLTYFGRAESWVEASLEMNGEGEGMLSTEAAESHATGEDDDPVDLLAPMTPDRYAEWRTNFLSNEINDMGLKKDSTKRTMIERTIPERLLDLIRLDVADFRDAGWSHFPGTRFVTYRRPREWNRPPRLRARFSKPFTSVRFLLLGKPLPRIEDTVRIGELFRGALMKRDASAKETPAPVLSGRKGDAPAEDHRHAFFLPEDADGDGWIDHLVLFAKDGLKEIENAIGSLPGLYGRAGEWQVTLDASGDPADLGTSDSNRFGSILLARSRRWISVTPYLHPWHSKKNFGPAEQLMREIQLRGEQWQIQLPPLVRPPEQIDTIAITRNGQLRRLPIHFHRFRSKYDLPQPDRRGSFWRLEFESDVQGPLAFGFASHFGLGVFRPEVVDTAAV